MLRREILFVLCFQLLTILLSTNLSAEVKTWDGKHSLEKINVQVVYFIPNDRQPLSDWKERADYYCKRIVQFHEREYGGQSSLAANLLEEPFVSELSTQQLREGDGDAIFFKTLREVDARLKFGQDESKEFPILLVLSEINWRPLDDFFRVKPGKEGYEFEGNFHEQQHFPGATSGGARATYLADQRKGWGLVSADGWRVPYRGSDCVVYHEGVGHTVGLPHPQPQNGSVMSLGQYRGWISESWLDKEQKVHMNWNPDVPVQLTSQQKLFSEFKALPKPLIPQPNETVSLQFEFPKDVRVKDCLVEYQTSLAGPWVEAVGSVRDSDLEQLKEITLGAFDRPSPVSYRVNVTLVDGSTAELWGYFQVRNPSGEIIQPTSLSSDLVQSTSSSQLQFGEEINVLDLLDVETAWKNGDWQRDESGHLLSPKMYGARIELPVEVPRNYRMVVIAEPLDPANGLLLGSLIGENRFVALTHYIVNEAGVSALENIDGQNVGNATTIRRNLLQQNRLSQIIVTVQDNHVTVTVDGSTIIDWQGKPEQLTLGDYWKTPNEKALFLGAYDCRYKFHRVSISEILNED